MSSDSFSMADSGNISLPTSAASDSFHQSFNFPTLSIHLDRSNYSLWRNTIRSALEAFGLDSFLTDSNPPKPTKVIPATVDIPEQIVPNLDLAPWIRRDRLVLLWIRSTLTTPLLGMVARASTTAEAWNILARAFHAQTNARQMHLRQQLQTLSKGSLSVLEYFDKKRAIVDSLSDCMCVISDTDFVTYLLYGLGSQYGAFCSALSMRTEHVSSDELLGLLLQEEQRQDEYTQAISLPSANAVVRSNARTTRFEKSNDRSDRDRSLTEDSSSDRPRMQCQICKRSDHEAINCFQPRMQCQICKRSGHEAINCFQRLNLRGYPATNRAASAKMHPGGKSAYTESTNSPSDVGDP